MKKTIKIRNNRKVLLIGLNFPPDYGGMRGWNIAKALKLRGYDVCVLTNFPYQPYGKIPEEYRWKLIALEKIDGIRFIRVPTLPLPNKGIASNLLTYFSFSILTLISLPFIGATDIVYSRGPQPFTEIPAFFIKKIKHSYLFLDVTDALPESLVLVKMNKVLFALLNMIGKTMNRMIYAFADGIVTLNKSMKEIISEYTNKEPFILRGVVDTQVFRPINQTSVYEKLSSIGPSEKTRDKFKIMYAGNIGRIQNLMPLIDAARKLKESNDDNIAFLIVGEGDEKSRLKEEAAKQGLKNLFFIDYQQPELMPFVINFTDVCLLRLMRPSNTSMNFVLFIALPKKIFEYAACGKPILCFSPPCEANNLIAKWRAGIIVDSEDLNGFVAAVSGLRNERKKLESMGRNARRMAEELFSLIHAGEALDTYFETVMEERE